MTTPQPPALSPWAFVCETVTGRVVRSHFPWGGGPRWDAGINSTGMLQLTVPLGDPDTGALSVDEIDQYLDYWRLSWGFAYGDYIVQCGPVVTDRFNDATGPPTVDVGCIGIWGLLSDKRVLLASSWSGTSPADLAADTIFSPNPTWTDGRAVPAANQDLSLQGVAVRLVADNLARPGCALPIDLPATTAGTAERIYPGYDLAYVGERIHALTQEIDGPEIEFRPYFTDSTRGSVRWEMRTGTPRLGDLTAPHLWHYGQAVTTLDVDHDGSHLTGEVFVRGGGSERSLVTGHATEPDTPTLTSLGWPALVTVNTEHTSATDPATVNSWAVGEVTGHNRPVRTLDAQVLIDGSDGQGRVTATKLLDQLRHGDTGRLVVTGHRRLPDGTYSVRVIGTGSGAALSTARLELDPLRGEL